MKPILFAVALWAVASGAVSAAEPLAKTSKDDRLFALTYQLEIATGMCDHKLPASTTNQILSFFVVDDLKKQNEASLRSLAQLSEGFVKGRLTSKNMTTELCTKLIDDLLRDMRAAAKP
jgi:hypothetical protein